MKHHQIPTKYLKKFYAESKKLRTRLSQTVFDLDAIHSGFIWIRREHFLAGQMNCWFSVSFSNFGKDLRKTSVVITLDSAWNCCMSCSLNEVLNLVSPKLQTSSKYRFSIKSVCKKVVHIFWILNSDFEWIATISKLIERDFFGEKSISSSTLPYFSCNLCNFA